VTFNDPDELNAERKGAHYREHRTFLWGAGNDDKLVRLGGNDRRPLTSLEILDWLCDLPKHFPKEAKYTGFGLSFDITQALKDLPFEVAWEIQHKKPFRERSYPPDRQRPASLNHVAIWHTVRPDRTRVAFAINYLKGKWLKVGRCANPDQIFKTNKKHEVHYDTGKPVTICDVFGYFQSSF
jgi:hypothetical protein